MTAAELGAVCARHGIELEPYFGKYLASWSGATAGNIDRVQRIAYTKADAVCALLKARWGMETQWDNGLWAAFRAADFGRVRVEATHDTEIAAVVALADELAAHDVWWLLMRGDECIHATQDRALSDSLAITYQNVRQVRSLVARTPAPERGR